MKTQIQIQRDSAIDILKLFCCFGVISIHVHSSTKTAEALGVFFGSFCVQFFFATSLAYFVNSLGSNIMLGRIAVKIWQRIGTPFVAWLIIYLSVITIKHIAFGKGSDIMLIRSFMYGEGVEHLYYLPELIVLQILALSIFMLFDDANRLKGLVLLVLAVCYFAWGAWFKYYGVLPLRAILSYLFVAFYLRSKPSAARPQYRNFILGVALIIIAVSGFFIAYPPLLQKYLISLPIFGIGLLLAASNIPKFHIPEWLTTLSLTAYGVYLSHVLFLEAIELVLGVMSYNVYYSLFTKLAVSAVVFFISVIFTLAVKRNALLKRVLLGEAK